MEEAKKGISREELRAYLDGLLDIPSFADYGPNGLQIEGKPFLQKIAFAVSATAESIAEAVLGGFDALIVHHGLFWKFHGVRTLTGPFATGRVFPLVRHEINLFSYHLPLDAHPEVGNAAVLARKLPLEKLSPLCDPKGMPLGVMGRLPRPLLPTVLKEHLKALLGHEIMMASPDLHQEIRTMGIITGGANSEWTLAKAHNLDSYLTGEMKEHDYHEARESLIHMFAGGHYATEQFGIQALMEKIEQHFSSSTSTSTSKVECRFLPSNNPA